MDAAVFVNPAARGGTAAASAARAIARLIELGVRVDVIHARDEADAAARVAAVTPRPPDVVVVAGGDGTVGGAINVLAATRIPLGIIPCGTGNDFASALGLGDASPERAADVIATGRSRVVDLARVTRVDGTQHFFATVLASGFDSRVNDRANAMRWPRGRRRYTLAILREFLTLSTPRFRVDSHDDRGVQESFEGPLLMATVGNSRSYGGGIPICPDASPDDGLLDLTLVRPVSRARLLALLPRVYAGTHTSLAEVTTRRVRHVRLDAPSVTAYADGDSLGALPVSVECAPGALTVVVP